MTTTLLCFSLFSFTAQAGFGSGDNSDDRTAQIIAGRKQRAAEAAGVNRLIEQSRSGTTPKGVKPLTPEQIAAIIQQRINRDYWLRHDCVPEYRSSFPDWDDEQILSYCRAVIREPGAEYLPSSGTPAVQAREIATLAVARLTVPRPTPHIGPDPSINQWKITAVGYSYWLWTDQTRTMDLTTTEQGITFVIHAEKTSTTFSMGDGNTKECRATTPWSKRVAPNQPSPTCGYVYEKTSGKGTFTLQATDHWTVTWTAAGQTGTIPLNPSESIQLNVKELQSVIR